MRRYFAYLADLFSAFFRYSVRAKPTRDELLEKQTEKTRNLSKQIAPLYTLPEGIEILDITDKLLENSIVDQKRKDIIQTTGRRVFIFTYPSDGLKIKGYISFIPHYKTQPVILYLRGGNRDFGLPNPGSDIACLRNYTILATTYRGGVSEGKDEFGGNDVNDVDNLVKYIPELEKKLNIPLQKEKMFVIGSSRGGMEMFLALGRSPELQKRVSKAVSLSGLLDIRHAANDRADMKELFIEDFGLIEHVNEDEWYDHRDPLRVVKNLRPDLPMLIIQGTADIRVTLEEGYRMVKVLQAHGNPVTYWEIQDGDHCLSTDADRFEPIADWLES